MGKIYSAASRVIVWLGPVDQSDMHMRALLLAMRFHLSDQRSVSLFLIYVYRLVELMNEQIADPRNSINYSVDCVLDAVRRILDRPWFGQVWVVQELALSKVATIQIGHDNLAWTTCEHFMSSLAQSEQEYAHSSVPRACERVFKLASRDHCDSQLERTLHLAATDPRDKVYSILGISEFADVPIKPDYGKSTRMVYSEAVACLLRENLPMIYFVTNLQPTRQESDLNKSRHLPSWVPTCTQLLIVVHRARQLKDLCHLTTT
jgi:hypothetical protein